MAEFGAAVSLGAGADDGALPPPRYSALLLNTLVVALTIAYLLYAAYRAMQPYWSLLRPRYRRFARTALAAMDASIKKKQ